MEAILKKLKNINNNEVNILSKEWNHLMSTYTITTTTTINYDDESALKKEFQILNDYANKLMDNKLITNIQSNNLIFELIMKMQWDVQTIIYKISINALKEQVNIKSQSIIYILTIGIKCLNFKYNRVIRKMIELKDYKNAIEKIKEIYYEIENYIKYMVNQERLKKDNNNNNILESIGELLLIGKFDENEGLLLNNLT